MDEMNIVSKFMRNIVSKIMSTILKKKFDCDVKIELNELRIIVVDGNARIHLDGNAELNKNDITKLIRSIKLET